MSQPPPTHLPRSSSLTTKFPWLGNYCFTQTCLLGCWAHGRGNIVHDHGRVCMYVLVSFFLVSLLPHLEFSSFGRVWNFFFESYIFVNWQCYRDIFVAGQENSSFGRQNIFSSKGRNIFVKKQPHLLCVIQSQDLNFFQSWRFVVR